MSKKAAAKAIAIDDSDDVMDVPSTPAVKKGKSAAATLISTPAPTPKVKGAAGAPATDPAPPKAKRAAKAAAAPTADAVLTTPAAKPRAKKEVTPTPDVEGGPPVAAVERPAENYSLKIAGLEKMATVMGCTNAHRVFVNVPPSLVDDKAMAAIIRDWGISSLKYTPKKGLEMIQGQLGNRADSNICVYGWIPEAEGVDPIFNKYPGYSYFFLYPKDPLAYAKRMVDDGATKEEAGAAITVVEGVYYNHLKYQEHKLVTVLV